MVNFAGLDVNVGEKLELESELLLERIRIGAEVETRGLEVELEVLFLYVGNGDGEVNEVLSGIGLVGALCPKNWILRLAYVPYESRYVLEL